jgi:phosphatidate cytidylyltransferase
MHLLKKVGNMRTRLMTSIALVTLAIVSGLSLPPAGLAALWCLILLIILVTEWPYLVAPNTIQFWLITPLYPAGPFMILILLTLANKALLGLLLCLVALHDTGSYLVGSAWGRHKICAISPQKSWEGLLGGYLTVSCALSLWLYVTHKPIPILFVTLFAAIISGTAFLGDLFESWLKRRAHIKNSGHLLPGHGGLLDRFDAVMFTAFVFYFFRHSLVWLVC